MQTLREVIADASAHRVAVGHFNFSNAETALAIFRGARSQNVPVILGVSEGERDFVGVRQAVALVRSLREEHDYPIFLNADHTYSFERVKEAVDAGFDAVIFDGTELPFEENVAATKKCVDYARGKNSDIVVEGELGFIGKSSKILEKLPEGVQIGVEHLTKPEDAKQFVEETGVDLLAPAIGNVHGMLKGGKDPALHPEVASAVSKACGIPLVLHGGSGNSAEDMRSVIASGVSIVHINTELRIAYRHALLKSLQEHMDETTPYKFLKPAVQAVEKVVVEKLAIFNNL